MRLFAGIPLPEELRERLTLLQGGIDGASWIPLENFHITLTFLGGMQSGSYRGYHRGII